jgi:hypothetical protein
MQKRRAARGAIASGERQAPERELDALLLAGVRVEGRPLLKLLRRGEHGLRRV